MSEPVTVSKQNANTSETQQPSDEANHLKETTLSNKELKELKKREKAAKRAAQKEASGITPEQQKQITQQKMEKMEKKKQMATNTNLKKQLNQTLIKDNSTKKKIPALFSHLETREQRNASSPSISHIVHPSILSLTLKYSTYKIVGSIPRLRHMLETFKVVINDYVTPPNTTLTRHLTGHLSHQIEYLKTARPLSVSMGNAIRLLKQEISLISIDTTEQQAKAFLNTKIDDFLKEKIDLTDRLIIENASKHITNNSTILTYGHSQVLENLFKYCVNQQGKTFNLIIVDSRPLFEGKKLLSNLVDTPFAPTYEAAGEDDSYDEPCIEPKLITHEHIQIQYILMNSLSSTILEDVDCVFLGAHAMLSNGHLFSRVGTGLIAMMCHNRNIPVLACCESIKFSDKVQLDSVTTNELADCEDLIQDIGRKRPPMKNSFALEQFIKKCDEKKRVNDIKNSNQKKSQVSQKPPAQDKLSNPQSDDSLLDNWEQIPNLSILNIMYDLTPPEYIKKVVTELGVLPPSSVPVILREYKNT